MIFGGGFRRDGMRVHSERAFDLAASFGLLVLASPLMLLTVLAIKIEDGMSAPVFYGQDARGLRRPSCSACSNSAACASTPKSDGSAQWATTNDDRVTRVGRYHAQAAHRRAAAAVECPARRDELRRARGPSGPSSSSKLTETIPYYRERHAVKPGITGWAQLCYPYGASEQDAIEKLQYDLYYVKNHGLVFDILILLQTVEVILLGKGAR